MKKILFSASIALLTIVGCGDSNEWTINGTIEGGTGKTLVLEASNNGRWYTLDSVKIDNSDSFSISETAAGYPDIYRLNLDGKMIYFPIDSIETITVSGNATTFGTGHTLTGTSAAEMLTHVDNRINEIYASKGEAVVNDSVLKRELNGMLLGNPAGIVSYYIINKKVGNSMLYDPANRNDLKVIGAVANAFNSYRPNDPRTEYLKNIFISNRRAQRTVAPTDTVYINETPIFDINLSDNTGKTHSLKTVTEQNKVVVLNFTLYNVEASPAFNLELAKIYKKRHSAGLEIYQVSVDEDEFQWKQSAKNLPWITVYNSKADGSTNLLNYNVGALPTTFIISKGELVERVDDITKLDSKLNKYM